MIGITEHDVARTECNRLELGLEPLVADNMAFLLLEKPGQRAAQNTTNWHNVSFLLVAQHGPTITPVQCYVINNRTHLNNQQLQQAVLQMCNFSPQIPDGNISAEMLIQRLFER